MDKKLAHKKMNINRNNYETFFILYIDNELSVQEKNAVDVFIQQNPDLKEELAMFQQSVVVPEAISFSGKDGLLKKPTVTDEMQEKLLLLLDKELNKADIKNITSIINQDDACKKEWNILQLTKITADGSIIFEDKDLLYKKENPGRVIAYRWWRMAAAAVLIGFGLWGAVVYFNNNKGAAIETAATNKQVNPDSNKKMSSIVKPQNDSFVVKKTDEEIAESNSSITTDDSKNTITPNNIKTPVVNKANTKETIASQQIEKLNDKPSNHLPVPSLENLNNSQRNNTTVTAVLPKETQPNNSVASNEVPVNKNVYASNASTTNNDLEKNTINYGFDDSEEENKKSKIGGFFKKVKRLVQRKTNTQPGGNDNFKIANLSFEIQ